MRATFTLTMFFWVLWGCNSTTKKKSEPNNSLGSTTQTNGKKFFQYDAIDHYSNDIAPSETNDLYDNLSKSEIDSLKYGVVLGDIPNSINDLFFIDKLEKMGFKKSVVPHSKFDGIDQIFVEKTTTDNLVTPCIYVYRDILIFKKDGKVVGTAKVCFGCMANQITGTKANTENFGQDGDYEKLGELLSSENDIL